jgi:hypothetical protein
VESAPSAAEAASGSSSPAPVPPSRKRRRHGTRWQRCTVRLLRAGSRQADHSLVTQKKTRERLPREPDPSSKGPTSRTGKPMLNVSPVERRPARRTEAGAASRTRGRLQPKPLRDPRPSNGASPPWSRGARPRSRSAWPASRPRSRPSEDRGPPPRGAGPVARGIDAAAGEPTSSTSSPEQLPSRRAGVGAASRNRNHQPPKRYQARHPANGSLSSVEPRPTPAEADQGSTSIGFEHHSSVQSEASQGIRNPCPANRAKLPHPMGSRCPAGKPAWSLLPVAEPRASSRRSRCALVPIVDAGGSQCQGVRQQAGIGPSSAFGRIASSRRTSRPNPRCRAPRPEGVGAIGFFERPDSISERPVSQRAGVAAGPCVRAEHVIPEESVMQHAMPGASSRGSRCLRPGERSRSPEEGDWQPASWRRTRSRMEHSTPSKRTTCRRPGRLHVTPRGSIRMSEGPGLVPVGLGAATAEAAPGSLPAVEPVNPRRAQSRHRRSGSELVALSRACLPDQSAESSPPRRYRARCPWSCFSLH